MKLLKKLACILMCSFLCACGTFSAMCGGEALTAQAAQPSSQLPINTSVVYFGGYQWWVVGNDTEGIYPQGNSLTLLAVGNDITNQTDYRARCSATDSNAKVYGYDYFTKNPFGITEWKSPNEYAGSALQQSMEVMAATLPEEEQALIQPRTFNDGTDFKDWDGNPGTLPSGIVGWGIANQKFWAISYAEFEQLPDELRKYTNSYALRTPLEKDENDKNEYEPESGMEIALVDGRSGDLLSVDVGISLTMRPAFSLDISSVKFVTGDKNQTAKSRTAAGSGLSEASIVPSRTTPAKLTVLDSDLALTVTADTEQAVQTGETLTFGFENAKGGYLSCILIDADGAVKYYGKLAEITSETSSGSLSIPLSGVADGTYTLNLFSEQCNSKEYTDFCSAPVTMTLSVASETGTVSDFSGTVLHTHSWSAEWSGDGTCHWHECTADGCDITDNSQKDGYGAHEGGTAVCSSPATCQVCGLTYGSADPNIHSNLEHVERKEATHLSAVR